MLSLSCRVFSQHKSDRHGDTPARHCPNKFMSVFKLKYIQSVHKYKQYHREIQNSFLSESSSPSVLPFSFGAIPSFSSIDLFLSRSVPFKLFSSYRCHRFPPPPSPLPSQHSRHPSFGRFCLLLSSTINSLPCSLPLSMQNKIISPRLFQLLARRPSPSFGNSLQQDSYDSTLTLFLYSFINLSPSVPLTFLDPSSNSIL